MGKTYKERPEKYQEYSKKHKYTKLKEKPFKSSKGRSSSIPESAYDDLDSDDQFFLNRFYRIK